MRIPLGLVRFGHNLGPCHKSKLFFFSGFILKKLFCFMGFCCTTIIFYTLRDVLPNRRFSHLERAKVFDTPVLY